LPNIGPDISIHILSLTAGLLKELDAANSKIADLKLELKAEHDQFKSTYQSLRTECSAQQHSDK